jgi:MFS family permease
LPLLAANLVCVAASLMFLFTPLLIDALRHAADVLSERDIALVGSSDPAGMFLGAAIALLIVPRADRRILAMSSLAVLCICDLVSMVGPGFALLCTSRVLAGMGAGMAMAVGYAAFGAAPEPERNFALFVILQTLIGSLAYLAISRLTDGFGTGAIYGASLSIAASALTVSFWIERRPSTQAFKGPTPRRRAVILAGLGALTVMTYFCLGVASLAIWENVQSLGRSLGLTPEAVAGAASFSLLGSVSSSLAIIVIGKRYGRALPTGLLFTVYLAGELLLTAAHGLGAFCVALTAFQCGTNFGTPAFGAISDADDSGRLSIAYLLALKAGFALGPTVAAWLLIRHDYRGMVAAGTELSVIAGVLLAVTLRVARPQRVNAAD